MTEREYLNTLGDEERIQIEIKQFREISNNHFAYINNLPNLIPNLDVYVIFNKYQQWLQSPHSTTADEDFAEIGFVLADESKQHFTYWGTANFDKFRYTVYNDTSNLTCMPSNYGQVIAYSYMEKLEKIADKKRKEEGWGE